MECKKEFITMKEYFEERMRLIMMQAKTKEELVVMEAMGIGDDPDKNFKSQ